MAEPRSQILKDALAILKVLVEANAMAGYDMTCRDILARAELTEDRFWPADAFLSERGCTEATMGGLDGVRSLTASGVEFFERSFQPSPVIQIGAVFQGDVKSSSVQAIANAVNSSVRQVIETSDPAEVREELERAIEDMVAAVKDLLDSAQLATYAGAARDLKAEMAKNKPDISIMRRLLGTLSFLGDLEGTIALAERALQLAETVAPYLPLLIAYLNRLA